MATVWPSFTTASSLSFLSAALPSWLTLPTHTSQCCPVQLCQELPYSGMFSGSPLSTKLSHKCISLPLLHFCYLAAAKFFIFTSFPQSKLAVWILPKHAWHIRSHTAFFVWNAFMCRFSLLNTPLPIVFQVQQKTCSFMKLPQISHQPIWDISAPSSKSYSALLPFFFRKVLWKYNLQIWKLND